MKLHKSRQPDYNLHNVVAVTIGEQRFDVVRALGNSHLIITAPRNQKWPGSLSVGFWHGRVRDIKEGFALYLVEAAHIVLHRAAVAHA